MSKSQSQNPPSKTGRIAVVLIGLGLAGYYAWGRYGVLHPEGINNGVTGEIRMPPAAERKRLEAEFASTTGLSTDTVTKLRTAFESNPREAMELANQTLTMDQKLSASLFMMSQMKRRDERLEKLLSEADMKALREKRSQRMGRNRWWSGGAPQR